MIDSGILQQMYTRERRGVFRTTEGFDTVAKSDKLDGNFVKKVLHPFCLYDAPAELSAAGEKEESKYPAAVHLFHTDSGETVIGRSLYKAADFTGLRSAFFTHNYIVPALRSEDIVTEYGAWLHADFADRYEGEPGGTLPELPAVPSSRGRAALSAAELAKLGIDRATFQALLQAAMNAVSGKKKMYVTLDVPVGELPNRAADVTELLMSALPQEFRRRLGVLTYASEPQSRKYIHLTFVESGSLRPGDRNIEKDYGFDLAGGRTWNADFGDGPQPYAELIWELLQRNREEAEAFADWADRLLRGEKAERRLSVSAYNELAVYYRLAGGEEALYEQDRGAVLNSLLDWLPDAASVEARAPLHDLLLGLLDREYAAVRSKSMPLPAVMGAYRRHFGLEGHSNRGRAVDYFIHGLLNAEIAGRTDLLEEGYRLVESDGELAAAFFRRVLAMPDFTRLLFQPYMERRLTEASGAGEVMAFAVHWGRFMPEAARLQAFRGAVLDFLIEKLQTEEDPVRAVADMHDEAEKAEKARRRGGYPAEALAFQQELLTASDRYLLHCLTLETLTPDQLLDIPFVRYPADMTEWKPALSHHDRSKAKVLRAAYRWFGEEEPDEHIFDELTPKELDEVQLLGRRWLQESPGAEPFALLPLAYYHSRADREGGQLEYAALLAEVRRKSGGSRETMYRFLEWSQDRPLFLKEPGRLEPGYRQAIVKDLVTHDREAFKSREFRKNHEAAAGPALLKAYAEARSRLATPVEQWVRRWRRPLLILVPAILVLAGGIAALAGLLGKDDPKTAPAGEAGTPAAAYILPADPGEDGGTARQVLLTFRTAADCGSFTAGGEISVQPGGKGEWKGPFPLISAVHSCGNAGASARADSSAGPETVLNEGQEAGAESAAPPPDGASPAPAAGTDTAENAGGSPSPAAAVSPMPAASPALPGADASAGAAEGTAAPASGPAAVQAVPFVSGLSSSYQVLLTFNAAIDLKPGDKFSMDLASEPAEATASPQDPGTVGTMVYRSMTGELEELPASAELSASTGPAAAPAASPAGSLSPAGTASAPSASPAGE
ncbi:GAP1-N2 domain-containing protein [Paenibacillus glufosinatiresistens]|uniref:GAP1-N2 domain-containing protein n=1 Tax=Paenibacillus glufosinatiresistens TaxID=3070657 RepID=UPI00286E787F|nr:hypothetical protein [Paenibacillus sp. YX.27]